MSLLPLRGESSAEPDEPQVLGLAGEDADEAFDVLSSSTTREVLSFVYDQPSTPAEIRDEVGTSLQNVHYHIDKLEEADLIEPAGTGYSEKGTEMTIYAPSNQAVVLFAGRESERSQLRQMLGRVFGVVFALAAGTLLYDRFLVDRASERAVQFTTTSGGDAPSGAAGGGEAGILDANGTEAPNADAATTVAETETTTTEAGIEVQKTTTTTTVAETETSTTVARTETTTTATTPAETDAPTTTTTEAAELAGRAAEGSAQTPVDVVTTALADPAVAFLLGGVFALAVAGVVWYASR